MTRRYSSEVVKNRWLGRQICKVQLMLQRRVLITLACCVFLLATASSASAAPKPCPGSYALLNADQAIAQPIFQEGIALGLFTEEDLRQGFAGFDENGNGLACFKPGGGIHFELPHPFRIIDDRI